MKANFNKKGMQNSMGVAMAMFQSRCHNPIITTNTFPESQ